MKTKKNLIANEPSHQSPTAPRLRKAGEEPAKMAAVQTEVKSAPVKKATINPEFKRTPRNAVEARSMFEALFNPAA